MEAKEQIKFEGKINSIGRDIESEEMKIQRLVKSNIISERFGKYLNHLSNLTGFMRMAEICVEYRQDNGRVIALENAEERLERAVAVYLSSDKRYGWTWDKMDDYMGDKLPEGHKELIDWAMEMKQCKTGERVYLVKSGGANIVNN